MHGNRRRPWTFWFLAWFFGTLAVMVIGLVIEQLVAPSPPSPLSEIPTEPAASPPASAPARTAAPSPRPTGGSPALAGPLQLVPGRQQINGVELGFPHSTVGAVSAADAATTEVLSTLDPDRAAAVMRMIADPGFPEGPQQAAEGAVNDRKAFGLPAGGPVPGGDSLQVEPVEYQVRDVTPGQVTVLLLCDFTSTISGQGTQTRTGVFPARVHWAAGDWKVLQNAPGNYQNLSAEPGSPDAASLGWQQLEPAGG